MVGAAEARSRYEQLRGKIRVTDVNPPITVSGLRVARFKARRSRMSSLRQQLEDKGYVIVSLAKHSVADSG